MKTNHSPAPWKICRVSDDTGDPEDTQIMRIEAANGTTILYTESGYFKPEEADACLIETAPELLDALQSLWGYVEDLRQSNPGYLGKLVLQDYGKMNEAFIKTARVLKKLL